MVCQTFLRYGGELGTPVVLWLVLNMNLLVSVVYQTGALGERGYGIRFDARILSLCNFVRLESID